MFRGQAGGGGLLKEGIFPWPCGVQCAGQERSRHLYPAMQHGDRERGMWLKRTQWREALNSTSEGENYVQVGSGAVKANEQTGGLVRWGWGQDTS